MADAQPDILAIFTEAVACESPQQREEFLADACGDDSVVRQRVDTLLRAHFDAGNFLGGYGGELGATIDQPITEKPGTQIGPYKLLQQLGEGGMGVVYMAEQKGPVKRRVALKIIKPGMDTRQVIARFEAERQALAMMDHPNIAKVLDAGATESGRPYFVMELVNGLPVTRYCDEQHLNPKERLELFVPICQAVQHAHQKGIIHRDLKPSNILVALYDGQPVPKIIDFGVAKATSQTLTEKTMFTQVGQVVGTLEYMSPEQAQVNQLDVDTRSDIYSLGVVLYELLTGDTPFDRARLRSAAFDEMLRIIREEEPSKPSTKVSSSQSLPSIAANRRIEPAKLGSMIRGELDWIVLKAMEKDRGRRYETASKFAEDVQHYLNDEPVVACPPSSSYRFGKFARRNKVVMTLAGMALLALLSLGVSGFVVAANVKARSDRDRQFAAQQAAADARLEDAILGLQAAIDRAESAGLSDDGAWFAVETALKTAEALAEAEVADAELVSRVRVLSDTCHTLGKDRRLMARLERIRLAQAGTLSHESRFHQEAALPEYAHLFQDEDLDLVSLPRHVIESRLAKRPRAVRIALWDAIGDWREVLQIAPGNDRDPVLLRLDELRNAAIERGEMRVIDYTDVNNIDEMRASSKSADVLQKPLREICSLGRGLCNHPETLEAGLELLERAQRQYPDDFWLNHELGMQLGEVLARRQEGIGYLRVAAALRPDSAGIWLNLGIALNSIGRHGEAVEVLHKAVQLEPEYQRARCRLADALREQGKLDQATSQCQRALELDSDGFNGADAHFSHGSILLDQHQLSGAIAEFEKAIELQPGYASAHNSLGVAWKRSGQVPEAIATYRKAIELDRNYALPHFNLGLALESQGRCEEAIASYRKAIELDPNYAPAHYSLGTTLERQERRDEAIASFRRAIELDPQYAAPHHGLGKVLHDQGKLNEAIACYRKALELDPRSAASYHGLGNVLSDSGQLDAAVACHRQALELDPKASKFHVSLGHALELQGHQDAAIASYRRAISIDLKNATAHYNLGVVLLKHDKLGEAIACYRKAIKLDPKYVAAHNNLGIALFCQGQLDAAIACFNKALEIDPQKGGAHNGLGIAFEKQGKMDDAIAAFRTAIELDPKCVPAYHNLGNVLWNQDQLDEAIACYRKALEVDPNYANAHNGLGNALRDLGHLDAAISCYRKAIEIDPNHVDAHNGLGTALADQGQLDKAIVWYRKAIEIDPNHVDAHNGLGRALADQGQLDEAIACYRKALELDPEHLFALKNLGTALACQGKLDEAIKHYRKALELDPKFVDAHIDLGATLADQGKLDEAIACWRKALEFEPKSPLAHNNLGIVLHRQGKLDEAIASWRKGLGLAAGGNTFLAHSAAWLLATAEDVKLREPKVALEFARKAVELGPEKANNWDTLGVALYRNAKFQAAVEMLQIAREMRGGNAPAQRFFLAMAYWKAGREVDALNEYSLGVRWLNAEQRPAGQERFRAEAEAVIGRERIREYLLTDKSNDNPR